MSQVMAFMPFGAADDTAQLVADITRSKREWQDQVCRLIGMEIARNDWRAAITTAVQHGNLSEAQIARGLEMTRSTVNRWLSGQTEPPGANMPRLGQKLIELVREG